MEFYNLSQQSFAFILLQEGPFGAKKSKKMPKVKSHASHSSWNRLRGHSMIAWIDWTAIGCQGCWWCLCWWFKCKWYDNHNETNLRKNGYLIFLNIYHLKNSKFPVHIKKNIFNWHQMFSLSAMEPTTKSGNYPGMSGPVWCLVSDSCAYCQNRFSNYHMCLQNFLNKISYMFTSGP